MVISGSVVPTDGHFPKRQLLPPCLRIQCTCSARGTTRKAFRSIRGRRDRSGWASLSTSAGRSMSCIHWLCARRAA
jgi:hypothetical protein